MVTSCKIVMYVYKITTYKMFFATGFCFPLKPIPVSDSDSENPFDITSEVRQDSVVVYKLPVSRSVGCGPDQTKDFPAAWRGKMVVC